MSVWLLSWAISAISGFVPDELGDTGAPALMELGKSPSLNLKGTAHRKIKIQSLISLVVLKTFLELYSKAALQQSPKQVTFGTEFIRL